MSYGPGPGFFAPRLGISWQPFDSDKLVVHAGAGFFPTCPIQTAWGRLPITILCRQNPYLHRPIWRSSAADQWRSHQDATGVRQRTPVSLTDITSQLMPSPFYRTPQTYEWSLSLQSQLAKNWGAEIAYVGNRGIHLDYEHDLGNQPKPGLGDLQPRRPFPDFGSLQYDDYQGYANYESVYAKLDKRLSHGFEAIISYTFAKNLDLEGGNVGDQTRPQDDNNPKADYGLSDENITHTFVASPIYQLPFGRGQRFLVTPGGS